MPRTCTCTCNYCRTINDNPGAQENSWLSRNRSPWNLVKIPLFILIVFLVTILGVIPAMLAGAALGGLKCEGVIPGMILCAIFWLWFVWAFSKEYLMNWCPTCSNKCRIDTAKELANQLFNSHIFPPAYQENLWRFLTPEVPPQLRVDEPSTSTTRYFDVEAPAPEPPVPTPLRADEPSTSTTRYLDVETPAPEPPLPPPLRADEPSTSTTRYLDVEAPAPEPPLRADEPSTTTTWYLDVEAPAPEPPLRADEPSTNTTRYLDVEAPAPEPPVPLPLQADEPSTSTTSYLNVEAPAPAPGPPVPPPAADEPRTICSIEVQSISQKQVKVENHC